MNKGKNNKPVVQDPLLGQIVEHDMKLLNGLTSRAFEADYPNGVIKVLGARNCGSVDCALYLRDLLRGENSKVEAWAITSPKFIAPMFSEIMTLRGIILLSVFHTFDDDGNGGMVTLTKAMIDGIHSQCLERRIQLLEIDRYDNSARGQVTEWVRTKVLST